ncbi:MAG: response regulator, partial [Verrucomicrobia bacterium]|nr:response regulator [Verrucomicrobiota bacterium]
MKQVLYVEDSATSQLLMRKYVAGMCELTITPSLRMAATLLVERKFDLLISDFIFPEGDALDLIQFSRKSEATKDMPIIVISGSMDGALLSRVIKAGANEGLSKPLATDEFRAVVTRMMSDPYVRSMERAICSVTCFQWSVRGSISQFCPELNLLFTGASKDEVSKRMLAALHERLAQGADVGYTNHEMVVTHV